MPLPRPSLSEIRVRIESDARARLQGLDPLLRRSLLRLVTLVLSAASHLLHGFAEQEIKRRMLPTARGDGLLRLAATWKIAPGEATFAEGDVVFTGTAGTAIPVGTPLQVDDGSGETIEYETTEAGIVGGAIGTRATVAGDAANQAAGALLELGSPIAGVDPTATVQAPGLVGGKDAEGDDPVLAALLDQIQDPRRGGSLRDWERWVGETPAVPGITRVWVTPPPDGSGVVSILFVLDGQAPITATAQQIQDVIDYLSQDDVKPTGAVLSVGTPVLVPFDMTVASLDPDTPEVRQAIDDEIAALILEDGKPGGTLLISRIREAVSRAFGEENHEVTAPVADVTHQPGELPVPGTITFA